MKTLLYIIILITTIHLSGQEITRLDTTVDISLVTIQEQKKKDPSATSLENSLGTFSKNFGDGAVNRTTSYIKSYGLGSLATLSLWGGGSNQNLIKWEGVPITNPMLGLADLSLIPTASYNKVTLYKGGCSAQHGSGAITGILNLKSESLSEIGTSITADMHYGSFGTNGVAFSASKGNNKGGGTINIYHKVAENDFSYKLGPNNKKQSNADLSSSGIIAKANYQVNGANKLGLDVWFQNSEIGIPPLTTQNTSVARQDDITNRLKVNWQHLKGQTQIKSYVAFLDEQNNYTDSLKLIFTRNRFKRIIHKTEATVAKGVTSYKLAYELNQNRANTEAYLLGHQHLKVFAIYGNIQHKWHSLELDLGLRNEWRNHASPPMIPNLSISKLLGPLSMKLKVSKEYRAPTLNELFWSPGGNLNLLPEEGWNQEVWLAAQSKSTFASLAVFHRKINNWILWAPLDDPFFWSAYNLGEVRSYGLDFELRNSYSSNSYSQLVTGGIGYSRSENLVSLTLPRINVGDQLLYTPKIKAFINLRSQLANYVIAIESSYTGNVQGINEEVNSFIVNNLSIAYEFSIFKVNSHIQLDINNLFNTEYRVIERRPMPGRYFSLNWSINLKNTSK